MQCSDPCRSPANDLRMEKKIDKKLLDARQRPHGSRYMQYSCDWLVRQQLPRVVESWDLEGRCRTDLDMIT